MSSAVPIEYLNTTMLCRWRFILGGGVESDRTAEQLLQEVLKSNSPVVLTKLGKELTIISKPSIQENGEITVSVDIPEKGEIYEKRNVSLRIGDRWLSRSGVHAALGALVAGGIMDGLLGELGREYRRYMRQFVPDKLRNFSIMVNGIPYHRYDAAMYLLINVLATSNEPRNGILERHMDFYEESFETLCDTCPFSAHCDVPLSSPGLRRHVKAVKKTLNAALYLENRYGTGWYLLYRTATRLAGYRRVSLERALGVELRHMGYNKSEVFFSRETMVRCINKMNISPEQREFLLEHAEELSMDNMLRVSIARYMEKPCIRELVERGYLNAETAILGPDYVRESGVVVLTPAGRLESCLWGGA